MFGRIVEFLREVRAELEKVSWPTREELLRSTAVVIAVTLAFAAFVGLIDVLLSSIVRHVLR